MKNKFKYGLKIFLLIIVLIFSFLLLLSLSALIPSNLIESNTVRSLNILKKEGYFPEIKKDFLLDNYTDAIMLNTAISVDNTEPFKSIILDRRNYSADRINEINFKKYGNENESPIQDLEDTLNDENKEYFEYSRYWHGYLIYLRPLLLIGDYSIVRLILLIIINLLSIYTFYLIYKNINIKSAIIFMVALLSVSIYIIGLSMQYSSIFIITLLSCIYLLKRKEKIKDINIIFCVIGATTCFMDLLTSPMITFCIPLVIYLLLNLQKDKYKIKDIIKKIIKLSTFWIIGYSGIWASKWIISDIFYDTGTIEYAVTKMLSHSRVNSYTNATAFDTIIKNIYYIQPYLYIVSIITWISFIPLITPNKNINKDIKKQILRMNIPYILISIMPFIWYIIVKNHSFLHARFTYKNLCITILGLLIVFINNLSMLGKIKSKENKANLLIINKFEFGNILKKLKDKDIFLITTVIYFSIVLLYELFYCNLRFFTGAIQSYNFSLYRIIVYFIIYVVYYKVKDKFISSAVETLNNKIKCYFIDITIFLTVVLSIALIILSTKNMNINIIIAFISLLIFNLFALYISNSIIKNAIITSLLFGTIFSISVTFNNQLDEKRHFLASYSIALGEVNLSSPKVDKSIVNMPRMMNADKFIKYFNQYPTGEITKEFSKDELEDTPCDYIVVSHFVSGIGVFISKTLGRKCCRHIHNRKNI